MNDKDSVELSQEIDFGKRNKGQICAYLKSRLQHGNKAESKERISRVFVRKMTAKLKRIVKKLIRIVFYDNCLKNITLQNRMSFRQILERNTNDISELLISWYMKILYNGLR